MANRPSGNRKYNVGHIWERGQEVIRMEATGSTRDQIAEKTAYCKGSIGNIVNSPLGKLRIEELRNGRDDNAMQFYQELEEMKPEALSCIRDILTHTDEESTASLRLSAAKDILDRTGHVPIKRVQSQNVHTHLDINTINEIKKRAAVVDGD